MAGVTDNITRHVSVENARYHICLKIACIFSKFHKLSNALICIVSDKRQWHNLPRVKVNDTHLMNNKLHPAENLCGECWKMAAILSFCVGLNVLMTTLGWWQWWESHRQDSNTASPPYTKSSRNLENICYKQIKICAEHWELLPNPQLVCQFLLLFSDIVLIYCLYTSLYIIVFFNWQHGHLPNTWLNTLIATDMDLLTISVSLLPHRRKHVIKSQNACYVHCCVMINSSVPSDEYMRHQYNYK